MANNKNEKRAYVENLVFMQVPLCWVNFRGLEKNGSNKNHERKFNVVIDPERFDVEKIKEAGWNIKPKKPKEGHEDEPLMYTLEVAMWWNKYPPVIHKVTKEDNGKYKRTIMTEKAAEIFDDVEIVNANLEISPYFWNNNGRSGIKATLRKAQILIEKPKNNFDDFYEWDDDDDPYGENEEVPFD